MHGSQRLLSQGQPGRQSLAAAGLQRRTRTRLGAGDRDRRGGRARRLPELSASCSSRPNRTPTPTSTRPSRPPRRSAPRRSPTRGAAASRSATARRSTIPGIVITASSGDSGYLNWFSEEPPANPPTTRRARRTSIAVGGTRLNLNATTKAWESETVWNDGGVSGGMLRRRGRRRRRMQRPASPPRRGSRALANWASVGCGSSRAVADVSADADPYTGVAVYDSTESRRQKRLGDDRRHERRRADRRFGVRARRRRARRRLSGAHAV